MKIIIVGAGEVGMHIASRLAAENKDVVLVDHDPNRVAFAKDNLDVQAITGHGSSPRVLRMAGIENADLLIAVTTSDEVNMVACLIAASQTTTPLKIARIRNPEYVEGTDILASPHLGVDLHINPEREAAEAIQKVLNIPCAKEVIDLGGGRVKLIGVPIPPDSPVIGQQLQYLSEFRPEKKVLIAAIQRGEKIVIPGGADTMEAGDTVWVISTPENIDHVMAGLGLTTKPVRRIMLFGATNVARLLAEMILADGMSLRIVEKDYEKCVQLAERFPQAVILHSPFVDQELLEEEDAASLDAFVSASEDDEDNILSALLAKRFGVKKVATVLERATYNQIISSIGVDIIVSKRLAAVNRIMAYMRKGKVRSEVVLGNQRTEVLEFEALETSLVVGKALKEIKFPKGVLIIAIIRDNDVIIPGGESVIQVGDLVLALTDTGNIKALENLFSVNLSFF
ncbi:MAG: Trk system potassium transporter TrkA [Candidatus Lernaella stagnicola]|nr:Trk system potassium transporter TrkA [Candidatus Lernaella stagnicola]